MGEDRSDHEQEQDPVSYYQRMKRQDLEYDDTL